MKTYWTLQKEEAWIQALECGYLEGNSEYAMFQEEYIWMMKQMSKILPNYRREHPIWIWIKKPDMRSSSHFNSGTRCVRLTVEIQDDEILISDFIEWHIVLNNGFNSDTEQEHEDFCAGKLNMTKEESWERIFYYDRPRDQQWCGSENRCLQGTTGRIDLSRVKKIEHFISRKKSCY